MSRGKKICRESGYCAGGVRCIEGMNLVWATQGTAGTSRLDVKGRSLVAETMRREYRCQELGRIDS